MYFDGNISENKYGKKSEGSYLSSVKNGEFYFTYLFSLPCIGYLYITAKFAKCVNCRLLELKQKISQKFLRLDLQIWVRDEMFDS